jgi:predicted ATPase
MSVKGYAAPDVEQVYASAYALCQQVEEPTQLLDALGGLWTYYLFRGQLSRAREIGERSHRLAQRQHDPLLLMISHFHLGEAFNTLGELVPGRTHLEQSLALFDPQQSRFVTSGKATLHAVLYRLTLAKTLWMLGYLEQAMDRIREAIAIAQDLSHPFSLVGAFATAAMLHQYRRESRLTQECADVILALVHEHGFTQYAAESAIYQGWGMATQDQPEEGMRVIIQGLDAFRETGVLKDLPHFLAMLVDVYGIVGQVEAGLTILAEALDLVEQTGERRYESELYCVKGEFLLQLSRDNHTEAEACFQHALTLARRQHAKSWELRAATSLARLWQSQDKCQDAYELLALVYGWFTEGIDTADLQEAKALLEDLE